jgi:FkbM family methyltransferase
MQETFVCEVWLDDTARSIRYIHQRLKNGLDYPGLAGVHGAPEQTSRKQAADTGPDPPTAAAFDSVRRALECAEEGFAARAVEVTLRRAPTTVELLSISEERAAGVSRVHILRGLLCVASEQGITPPPDWSMVLPRHINVAPLVAGPFSREEFVSKAYEIILGRTPSVAEVASQVKRVRRVGRSDFVAAMAVSEEASRSGGEIVLTGLGGRSFGASLKRYLSGRTPATDQTELASQTAGITGVLTRLAHLSSAVRQLELECQRIHTCAVESNEQLVAALAEARNSQTDLLRKSKTQLLEATSTALDQLRSEIRSMVQSLAATLTSSIDTRSTEVRTASAHHTYLVAEKIDQIAATVQDSASMATSLASLIDATEQRLQTVIETKIGMTIQDVRDSVHSLIETRVAESLQQTRQDISRLATGIRPPVISAGDVVVVEVDGFLLGIASAEWRSASYYHYRGPMEPGVYSFFKKVVRPGMIVADVGANVGLYTLLAARLLQGDGRIHSFEPTPAVHQILRNNVQLNGFLDDGVVSLHELAVSDSSGRVRFYGNRSDSTHNSLYSSEAVPQDEYEVSTTTIDEVFGSQARLDFIKVDVEGAEPAVFRGMQQTLKRNPHIAIVAEFAPRHIARGGVSPHAFLEEMVTSGLRARMIDDLTGDLTAAPSSVLLSRDNTNLLLTQH